jgi:predicted Holliday junction resolvase-like endonuclease
MEQSVYEFLKDETKKEKERRERELVALKVAEERREGELAALTSEAVRGRVNKNLINFNPNLNILKPKEITPLRP